MATSLKNILPDYEALFKGVAREKMKLKALVELEHSKVTDVGRSSVWGYSEYYEWKSA